VVEDKDDDLYGSEVSTEEGANDEYDKWNEEVQSQLASFF
jgi:hypothetical protein